MHSCARLRGRLGCFVDATASASTLQVRPACRAAPWLMQYANRPGPDILSSCRHPRYPVLLAGSRLDGYRATRRAGDSRCTAALVARLLAGRRRPVPLAPLASASPSCLSLPALMRFRRSGPDRRPFWPVFNSRRPAVFRRASSHCRPDGGLTALIPKRQASAPSVQLLGASETATRPTHPFSHMARACRHGGMEPHLC